jgi:hypothetical protein
MPTKTVKSCFTIAFTEEQLMHGRAFVDDMKRHPNRVYWEGKKGKTDDELIVEYITHRVLSGFYHSDPLNASRCIVRMDSMTMS